MSSILDSPFIRAFAVTNSVILSVGALYLVASADELQPIDSGESGYRRASDCITQDNSRVKDLHDFSHALSNWNENLADLEDIMSTKGLSSAGDLDEVDGLIVRPNHHHPRHILETLDETLNDLMVKVTHIRQLVKEKQRNGRDFIQNVQITEDFASPDMDLFDDEDSEADSFLSAASDVEEEDDMSQTTLDVNDVKLKALQIAGINRHLKLYMSSLELYFKSGIKCRKKRTKMVGCRNDIEFLAKVHCIREASKIAFADQETQQRLEQNICNILDFLLRTSGKDYIECRKRWKALVAFCKLPRNSGAISTELLERGVPHMTFYDVVLDFVIMDAFEDLENPPYSIQATVQNSWIPAYIQQTGLETAVWGVLKAKMQLLQDPAGFLMHFYHLSEISTPVLAWGFLGSDVKLTKACNVFKKEMMGYVQDLFNTTICDYNSVETLSKDIVRLADSRYDNLRPLLIQANGHI